MVDFVGLMSGFNEREKENVASRKDMAKAFADFKAANPYASAAEFQSFIDSYSGGRNYIAGGAPGSEIIKALGQANTDRQARDLLRQQIADASERNIFRDNLRTSAEGFLLDLSDENPNFVDAYGQFISEMGVEPQFAKQIFGEENLSSIFNQQNVNRLRRDEMNKNMPAFMDYLKSTGGDVSAANLKAAAEKSGVPLFMVQDAQKIYKEQTDNARIALESERKDELLNLAIEAIERGDPDIASVITGRAKTLKFNTDAPEFTAYVNSLVKQANTTATQNQADRQNAQLQTLVSFVNEQVALGNDQLLDITLSEMAKTLQISTKGPAWETYKKRVLANAKLVRDRETEDRTRAQNTENAAAANTFRTTLENNRGINDLIQRGMLDEAQARIDEMVGRYSDANVQALMREIGDGFINARVSSLQEVQDNDLGTLRMKSDELAATSAAEYKTSNVAKAESYFTDYAGKDKTNPNAGVHGGNAAMAAKQLATEFNMSPTVLALMADAFATMPEGTSPVALADAARSAISGYAQPFQTSQSAFSDSKGAQLGYFGNDTTVAEWTNRTEETIGQHGASIMNQIDKIRSLQGVDPETKIKMLEGLGARMEQGFVQIRNSIQAADKYSTGQYGWVTKGTPMFDINQVYYGPNGLKKNIDSATTMIQKDIASLTEELSAQAAANPQPAASANTNQNASNAASAFGRYWEEIGNRRDRRSELYRTLKEKGFSDTSGTMDTAGQLGGLFGSFTDQQLEDNRLVYEYLVSAGNETRILDSAEEYGAFLADPAGYVRSRIEEVGTN
tara:strand:+ start:4035 stop:6416 length:2382 start_codon:yes stop_codon:yes gene_type:complete